MVSVLSSRSSGLDSSPGWEHCVVFLHWAISLISTALSYLVHPPRREGSFLKQQLVIEPSTGQDT